MQPTNPRVAQEGLEHLSKRQRDLYIIADGLSAMQQIMGRMRDIVTEWIWADLSVESTALDASLPDSDSEPRTSEDHDQVMSSVRDRS